MSGIPVGISTCLLGQEVRHDGGHKHSRFCTQVLARHFDFRPLCPEMAAGLGVPRPAIHIREIDEDLRLTETRGDRTDHTEAMEQVIRGVIPTLGDLRGYILMAKSPSCGMERIKVHNAQGQVTRRDGRGLFAAALMAAYPLLPVEEEGRLHDDQLRENFIERVFAYDDWLTNVTSNLTPKSLIDFHTRHKFQLLAHNEPLYRQLGPLLSDLKAMPLEALALKYITGFMQAMTCRVSRGAHVNAMQHLMGYLREAIGDADRNVLMEQIEAYHRGELPLIVPMTLLRMAQRREPVDYVELQHYLSPYPDELGLRNRV